MSTNYTNKKLPIKVIFPELSYLVTGVCFSAHNELGPYSREKQYGDKIEQKLKESKIPFKREGRIGKSGNVLDFIIDDKMILEIKSKRALTKEDYYQTQRYLQITGLKLALLINFRNKYIKPVRVIKIETESKKYYIN